jgi:hypothetical protein
MSTFPVHEILCSRVLSERIMSLSRSDTRLSGVALRPTSNEEDSLVEVVSPGFSSLSSLSTNQVIAGDITCVWDFPKLERTGRTGDTASQSWKCLWCNGKFRVRHATKALIHISKATGKTDIKACTGPIPIATLAVYRAFRNNRQGLSTAKRQHIDALADRNLENQQRSLAIAYQNKRLRSSQSSSTANSVGTFFGESDGGVGAVNAVRLTLAIAEFVYCKGLSFSATEGDYQV